ncbi:MAG: diaminopimelate epimerase [Saprospiraceae bacterium]|uniref:Diaminopimelate epimerase n=1 Tax=Candidatus Opimibacter skivensis TaxID=2982028 RepID=A0A9D7SY74_9BACT|nr:diaminopimelate epimerase [Candidatus Opimibacter skivensis]
MNNIPFVKYHGAGNDFILIDDREGQWGDRMNETWIAHVCHRRFGIGADGLILLQKSNEGADFFMKYYNSDGRQSTFCGNGGRCIVSFAAQLGIHHGNCKFLGTDGWHTGSMDEMGLVNLSMTEVHEIKTLNSLSYSLYTGSPHYVTFVDDVENIDVQKEGRAIRNSSLFEKEGINVNFAQIISPSEIRIRTYERGVEDETMACGTGVVASAIAFTFHTDSKSEKCKVTTQGGVLNVEFNQEGKEDFTDVRLIGPAVEVFRGEVRLD